MTELILRPANIEPTVEQLAIQTARVKHLLVEANAGAAKTTTLALRIAQALARGARPSMILALTYTEPAVQALFDRLRLIGISEDQISGLSVHTFESFSALILERMEGARVLALRTQEQVKPYVLRAIERARTLPAERYPEMLATPSAPSELVEGILKSFSLLKGRMALELLDEGALMSPDTADELGVDYFTLRVRNAFERIRKGGHPDHPEFRYVGDACYDLARAALEGQLSYEGSPLDLGLTLIAVDEMHDTNRAMFTVLQAVLQRNSRAAFVGVGDRDQVIHSQAGADAAFMKQYFVQEIGVPKRLPLTASHRFGTSLARAAGALARKPYDSFAGTATSIDHLHAESNSILAKLVAHLARDHMRQEAYQSMRILLRWPAQSILIERELLALGVDYQAEGFDSFLRRREVLLVRGLYAYCTNDYVGFEDRALREQTLSAMLLFAGAWIESHESRHLDAVTAQRRAIQDASIQPDGMVSFIENQIFRNADASALALMRAGMEVLVSGDLAVFGSVFLGALDPHSLAAKALVRRDDVKQVHQNLKALVDAAMLENGSSLSDFFRLLHQLDGRRLRMRTNRRLALSSIEASKGLEFDHVVIPNLTRGEFVGGDGGATENRNLLYVAMTRARRRLTLGYDPMLPSKFLADAGLLPSRAD